MSSDKQVAANRANAQKSTGPVTEAGRAASRMNALKHGIHARMQFLPGEDQDLFQVLAADYRTSWNPIGGDEIALVDTLIRSDWHIRRFDVIIPITIANAMDKSLPHDHALAKVYAEAAAKSNHPFTKLERARAAAQRDWFRAMSQLQKLQKKRMAEARAEALKPAPEYPENDGTNPIPEPPTVEKETVDIL